MSAAASFFWFWYASSVSGSFLLNLSRLFLAAPVAFPPEGGAGAGGAAKDEVAPDSGAPRPDPDSELEVALAKASFTNCSTRSASLVDVAG